MRISIVSGVAEGPTILNAFDNALTEANIGVITDANATDPEAVKTGTLNVSGSMMANEVIMQKDINVTGTLKANASNLVADVQNSSHRRIPSQHRMNYRSSAATCNLLAQRRCFFPILFP